MLIMIAGVIILLWIIGFIASIGGSFIHLLLVIAAIIIIYDFIHRRRTV